LSVCPIYTHFVRLLALCLLGGRTAGLGQLVKNAGIGLDQSSETLPGQLHRAITAGNHRRPGCRWLAFPMTVRLVQRTQSARHGRSSLGASAPRPIARQLGPAAQRLARNATVAACTQHSSMYSTTRPGPDGWHNCSQPRPRARP
jgi:hypothetical protein